MWPGSGLVPIVQRIEYCSLLQQAVWRVRMRRGKQHVLFLERCLDS